MPGGQSRWSQGKDLSWEPLRADLVVEVAYEHMQGTRFRHMAQFRRWRTDKRPSDCTYAQLEVVPPQELMEIFAAGRGNRILIARRAARPDRHDTLACGPFLRPQSETHPCVTSRSIVAEAR